MRVASHENTGLSGVRTPRAGLQCEGDNGLLLALERFMPPDPQGRDVRLWAQDTASLKAKAGPFEQDKLPRQPSGIKEPPCTLP